MTSFSVTTSNGHTAAFFRSRALGLAGGPRAEMHWRAVVRNPVGEMLYEHLGSTSLDDVASAVVLFLGSRGIWVDLCSLCHLPVSSVALEEGGDVYGAQHVICPESRP